MTFSDAIKHGFKNYANFSGTVGRPAYWYWYLFTVLISFGLNILWTFLIVNDGSRVAYIPTSMISGLVSMGLFLPSLALMIRRLRDAGNSPLYLLLSAAPLVLAIVFAITGAMLGSASNSGAYSNTTAAAIYAGVGAVAGLIIGGMAAGIWLIVLLAQPTKTLAQGNKYATA